MWVSEPIPRTESTFISFHAIQDDQASEDRKAETIGVFWHPARECRPWFRRENL